MHAGHLGAWPPTFSETFVEQARERLAHTPILAIVGPVGGSRNSLAAAVARAPEGPIWSRHVSRFGERERPYFAIGQILRQLRTTPELDPEEVERSAQSLIAAEAEARPTIILANLDLCDEPSIEVLTRLAQGGSIRLVVTLTPETAADERWRLLRTSDRIEIPPLDADTTRDLLRRRFLCDVHPGVVHVLLERSAGVYAVIREVADAAYETGMIEVVEGVLVLTTERDTVQVDPFPNASIPRSDQRLGGDDALTDLIDLAALIGRLDLAEARRTFAVGSVVDRALRHGAMRVEDRSLVVASTAEAGMLARTMPQERQAELYDRYADDLTTSCRQPGVAVACADWCRAAGHLLPVDLAAEAGKEANLRGLHRRAVVFTEPAENDQKAWVAPVERAFALLELGDQREIDELFTALDPATLTEDELLPYLRWAARAAPGDTGEELRARAVEGTEEGEPRRRRRAVLHLTNLLDRVFSEGGDDLAGEVRALMFSDQLTPANRAMAFTALSAVQRNSGRPTQAIESAQFALDILLGQPDHPSAFHLALTQEFHILALIASLDLAGADLAVRAYATGIFGQVGSGRLGTALRGFVELLRGNTPQALASARLCLDRLERNDPHQMRGWVEAVLAQILVQCDRHDEAVEALQASQQHVSRRPHRDLERRIAIAVAQDALGEPEEALEILDAVVAETERRDLLQQRIEAAALTVQIGGPAHLPVLLTAVDGLVDATGSPLLWQAFARAARDYDFDELLRLSQQLERRQALTLASEVSQYVLDVARRREDLGDDQRRELERLADPFALGTVGRD